MDRAGQKIGKTECDVRVDESVAAVEERAARQVTA